MVVYRFLPAALASNVRAEQRGCNVEPDRDTI